MILPPSTYTGRIDNSINNTLQGEELVKANQAQAAALGITIPGVSSPINRYNEDLLPSTASMVTGKAAPPGGSFGGVSGASPVAPPVAPTSRYTGAANAAFAPGGAFAEQAPYTPEQQQAIRDQQRSAVQSQIDAINEAANLELANAQQAATQRLGQNRARLSATGQLGSGGESTSVAELDRGAQAEQTAILNKKKAETDAILAGVENTSRDIIDKQRTLAQMDVNAKLQYLSNVSTQAVSRFEQLAKGGAELTPEQRQMLIDQTGYDPATFDLQYQVLKIANSNDYINKDKPIISADGKTATYVKIDPKTGKIAGTETIDLPSAPGKTIKDTVNRDDGIYVFYTDNTWDKVGGPSASYLNAQGGASSNKNQQALEQQYRQALLKELSNRSGGLGLQDAKVNQAIHLKALFDQFKNAKGDYDIPQVQYTEIAMGLANLVAPTGQVSDSAREAIMQKTASGDFRGALTYAFGFPLNGTTQAVLKNLYDSIIRQGNVSEDIRDQDIKFLHGLAPTDLDPDRIAALEKNSLASFKNPNTVQYRAEGAGYDYAKMKSQGFSDEEIDAALKATGK